ncbi:unnamed protein product, partial [Rotaria socialis]
EFHYPSPLIRVLNSTLNTDVRCETITVNTNRLILYLTDMVSESALELKKLTMNYNFQNVTELELIIGERWHFGFTQHLSKILNLSNLQSLSLDFKSECKFETSLDAKIAILFKKASNLRSISTTCNGSHTMAMLSVSAICLRLPRQIKHLDTEIMYMQDAIVILRQNTHW